jgi:uracil phosphoribosyltransferase
MLSVDELTKISLRATIKRLRHEAETSLRLGSLISVREEATRLEQQAHDLELRAEALEARLKDISRSH